MRSYPEAADCPCESGMVYGDCCKLKGIQYGINEKGRIFRSIKYSRRLKQTLRSAQLDFKRCFGRDPAPFDPVALAGLLHSPEDYSFQMRRIGKAAGLSAATLFATERTGLIVSESNLQSLPTGYLEEWDNAISEFEYHKKSKRDPFFVFSPLSHEAYSSFKRVRKLIEYAICVGTLALHDTRREKNKVDLFERFFGFRSIASLRTVHFMYLERYDDDCLAITRSIYEGILRLVWLRHDPDKSVRVLEALLGRENGKYIYPTTKRGRVDYGRLVEVATGCGVNVTISNRYLASLSDPSVMADLHEQIFSILSGYVHADITHLGRYSDGESYVNPYSRANPYYSMIFVGVVGLVLLHQIRHVRTLKRRRLRNLNDLIGRYKYAYGKYISGAVVKDWAIPFPAISAVVAAIPDKI
jgi:hypothetical protein